MSKATPTDVTDLGFSAQQFGAPEDWAVTEPPGYLQRVLDAVAVEVQAEVGAAAYAAAESGTPTHTRLVTAESYLAGAELWRRLEAWERANAARGRDGDAPEAVRSRLLANAEAYEARGWAEVARVTGRSREAGIAVTTVRSSYYP